MAGYQKKIAYLDYLENGMKIKNAGFVRIEENNGQKRLEMRVKNIPEQFSGEYELQADVGGIIGRISLSRGSGGCCVVWNCGNKVTDGRKWVKADGIFIRLPGRHLVQTVWSEPISLLVSRDEEEEAGTAESAAVKERKAAEREAEKPAQIESAAVPEKPVQAEAKLQTEAKLQMVEVLETETLKVEVQTAKPTPRERQQPVEMQQTPQEMLQSAEAQPIPQEILQPAEAQPTLQSIPCTQPVPQPETQSDPQPVCYSDKWEQLSHTYPQLHPFGDDRMYLSIAPKDFVVLRQEFQKMVHNSFLLHGFYNYKHLILGKIKESDGWNFYLGVPGNFYNREKMVAEMFGFEAFEGAREPAEAGDFGYFMKKVEI